MKRMFLGRAAAVFMLTWILTALMVLPVSAAESVRQKLDNASTLRHRNQHDNAIKRCKNIIKDSNATKEHVLEAFDIYIDVYRRQRKYDNMIKIAQRMRGMFKDDKDIEKKALFIQADVYRATNKHNKGIEKLDELIKRQPNNKRALSEAYSRMAYLKARQSKSDESYEAAKKSIELDASDDKRVSHCLNLMQDAAWRTSKIEDCIGALKRLLDQKYLKHLGKYYYPGLRNRYGDCLVKLKRFGDARAHYARFEKDNEDMKHAQECALRIAHILASEKKYEEALKTYERTFTKHAERADYWYYAQAGIVDVLIKQSRFKEAISAVRVSMDGAWNRNTIADRARKVAEIFKGLDGNVARANAFINYQKFGPAGPDGKPGTGDDLTNPLDKIAYPRYPERERVFEETRKKAGDNAASSRHRGMTYIYSGRSKEASRHFMDAFRRCDGRAFQSMGEVMIVMGIRAVRGHSVGLEQFFKFVNFGPNGPDGKSGTNDDIADPFVPLLGGN